MALPFPFVLDELRTLFSPDRLRVKPMFGCHALYVDQKIVFILRSKGTRDDGVWVALSDPAHAVAMRKAYPVLRRIEMFAERAFLDWLNLPATEDGFEELALEFCGLVGRRDRRIGKVPKGRKKK